MTSIFGPEIKRDYDLTQGKVTLLTSTFQVGLVLGSLIGAELCKYWGRSLAIKLVSVIHLFAGLSIYCFNYKVVCTLFVLYGVFTGFCLNVLPVYISEIAPVASRGRWMITLSAFMTFGKVGGAVLARFFLEKEIPGSWKMLFVYLTIAHALVLPFVLLFLKDLLRFLAVNHNLREFKETFNLIAWTNNLVASLTNKSLFVSLEEVKRLSESLESQNQSKSTETYRTFCSKQFFKINLLTGGMWIAAYGTINGQNNILAFWFNSTTGLTSIVLTLSGEIVASLLGFCLIEKLHLDENALCNLSHF